MIESYLEVKNDLRNEQTPSHSRKESMITENGWMSGTIAVIHFAIAWVKMEIKLLFLFV